MAQNKKGTPSGGDAGQNGTAAFIWLFLAAAIGILLFLMYVFSSKGKKKKATAVHTQIATAENTARQVAGARRHRRMRVRRGVNDSDDDLNTFEDDDNNLEGLEEDQSDGKVGTKKARKLEMKAEKKAQREAQQQEREEKKKRDALLESERKKDDERKLLESEERKEQERLRKEEEEEKEYEKYLQIKASFVVEESGEVGIISQEESQSLLQEFIDYIKNAKVINLEDLGTHFNLKTQEAIERLEHLLEIGRITGVMDDRGKFIYISEEELKEVATFIKQRGRISIMELAESSNALINMQGSTKEKNITC